MKRQSRLRLLARLKVYESYMAGLSLAAIADKHQISLKTAARIVEQIRDECYSNMASIAQSIPLEYQMSISLHKSVMAQAQVIADTAKDPRVRMEALRLSLDCRKYLDSILVDSDKILAAASAAAGTSTSHHVKLKSPIPSQNKQQQGPGSA